MQVMMVKVLISIFNKIFFRFFNDSIKKFFDLIQFLDDLEIR